MRFFRFFRITAYPTPSTDFIITAFGRAHLRCSGFLNFGFGLGFGFGAFLLVRASTHYSSFLEVLDLFFSGLFTAVSCGLTAGSLGRFHKSLFPSPSPGPWRPVPEGSTPAIRGSFHGWHYDGAAYQAPPSLRPCPT